MTDYPYGHDYQRWVGRASSQERCPKNQFPKARECVKRGRHRGCYTKYTSPETRDHKIVQWADTNRGYPTSHHVTCCSGKSVPDVLFRKQLPDPIDAVEWFPKDRLQCMFRSLRYHHPGLMTEVFIHKITQLIIKRHIKHNLIKMGLEKSRLVCNA